MACSKALANVLLPDPGKPTNNNMHCWNWEFRGVCDMYSTQRGADQADFFCGCCRRCRRCVLGLETVAQPSSLLLLIVRPLWLQTSSLLWLSRRAVKRNGKQKRERFIENKRAWARGLGHGGDAAANELPKSKKYLQKISNTYCID